MTQSHMTKPHYHVLDVASMATPVHMQSISNVIASALSPLLQSGASTSVGQQSATSGHGGGGSP